MNFFARLPKLQLQINYDTVIDEYPIIESLCRIGKYFHILPFDKKLLQLTYPQIQILMEYIIRNPETTLSEVVNPNSDNVEVYTDTDFEKEFADVLSEVNSQVIDTNSALEDWVDIPPPPPEITK